MEGVGTSGPYATPDDDSANPDRNHNGTMFPARWPPTQPYAGAPTGASFDAAFGQCFYLDGTNHTTRLGTNNNDQVWVPDDNVRVECFARFDRPKLNDNSGHYLFYQAERFGFYLTDRSEGDWRFDFRVWTPNGLKQLSGVIPHPEEWHHYAWEFRAGELEGFIDGVSVGTATAPALTMGTGIRQLTIGGSFDGTTALWQGPIEEFRISLIQTGTLSPFEAWISHYPVGSATNLTDNPDGDLLNNLYEWGLGGNPTDPADIGHAPTHGTVEDGGATWLEYVYAERNDAGDLGLTYWLEQTTDLVTGDWTNAHYEVVDSGTLDGDFDTVTNRVPTDAEDALFIKLMIESN